MEVHFNRWAKLFWTLKKETEGYKIKPLIPFIIGVSGIRYSDLTRTLSDCFFPNIYLNEKYAFQGI